MNSMGNSNQTTSLVKEASSLNSKLVDKLIKEGDIKSHEVEKIMKSIDRGDFTPKDPYSDM